MGALATGIMAAAAAVGAERSIYQSNKAAENRRLGEQAARNQRKKVRNQQQTMADRERAVAARTSALQAQRQRTAINRPKGGTVLAGKIGGGKSMVGGPR